VDSHGSGYGLVAESCAYSDEPLGSVSMELVIGFTLHSNTELGSQNVNLMFAIHQFLEVLTPLYGKIMLKFVC
jgi:hypothetical protein